MVNGGIRHRMTGNGPLVVLLHPVGLDGTFWGELPAFLGRTHAVAAADLTGHGESPPASRPGRMETYVADVVELLERLDRGPAIVVGVSFGGMIAQHLALGRPELVAGLVLGACPGKIPPAARDAILQRGRDAEVGGMEAVIGPTLQRWFTPAFLGAEPVDRVRRRLLSNALSNWAAAWEAVAEHDALDRLAGFRGPALVVAGESDAATPLEAKRELAAAMPQGRLVVMPQAPHMMHIECADRFAETVGAFVAQQSGATS